MSKLAGKKSDYTGWQDVFKFSFCQGIKAKAYYVSLLIFVLVILIGVPAVSYFQNREEQELGATQVANLIIYDETGLPLCYDSFVADRYEALSISLNPSQSYEEGIEKLEQSGKNGEEKSRDVILRIRLDETQTFLLTFIKASAFGFDSDDYDALVSDFVSFFYDAKREAIEVSPEQEAYLNQGIETSVLFAEVDESGEVSMAVKDKVEGVSMVEYNILLGGIIVVMMIINLAGGQIANGIVTEKSTRVVEYLMINIRPMALIVGKILAAILQVIIQLGAVLIAYGIGKMMANNLFGSLDNSENGNAFTVFFSKMSEISFGKLCLCLVIIILGILFFSILAGLAGASVSKVDELAEGMKLYQTCLIVGSYIGIGVCIMQINGGMDKAILNLICLIPISAPFVLPANILLGKVDLWIAFAGSGLLLVLTTLLFVFTSRVYEAMIFYNGNVLKLKDILQLAKNTKTAAVSQKEVE